MALVPYDTNRHILHELHDPRRVFSIGGHDIEIEQTFSSNGVAGCVWQSAVVLAQYFAANTDLVKDKNVLELGAGTGLLGIACHHFGGNVISTDHEDAISSTEMNFKLNEIPLKHCRSLNWGSDIGTFLEESASSPPDVVLGADIVYIKDTFDLLMKTLIDISSLKQCPIYLACKIRYEKDENFIKKAENFFKVEDLDHEIDLNIKIYRLDYLK